MNATCMSPHGAGDGSTQLPVRSPQDLAWARATVTAAAHDVGMSDDRAARLALAVSEVAANALVHADGTAHVKINATLDWLTVEVSDHGPGLRRRDEPGRPDPRQDHGRGLWLAGALCDRMEIMLADGTRVALSMRR